MFLQFYCPQNIKYLIFNTKIYTNPKLILEKNALIIIKAFFSSISLGFVYILVLNIRYLIFCGQ